MTDTATNNSNWETFKLSVSFAPTSGEEIRLQALKESVSALRNNVIELRAKKLFLSSISNVTDLENVLPSAKQISKIEEANATARQKWEESSRHAEENFASASKTVEALADSFQYAQKLAADLEARKAELQASTEQVELLLQQERDAPEDPSAVPADVTKLLETVGGIRLSTSDSSAGQLRVSFVHPAEAVGSSILFGFEYLGGRAILRSASLDGPSIPDARDLVAFSVALDDPAFLVEEVRLRLRCASLRTAEVDALKAARHIVFEQNGLLRFTFPSGVMATIETAPDYPLGAGSVRLASLDTMGLFSDNLQSVRAMLSKCTTIKEHVEALASKFGKK